MRTKIGDNTFPIIFPLILVFVLLVGALLFYQSRRLPELDETHLVTVLPPDVKNALEAKTGTKVLGKNSIRIPIFLYHYVEYVKDKNDKGRQSLNIPPDVLKAQIKTLKEADFTFVTPTDLTKALNGNTKNFPNKPAMLSFDDGYMDLYTDVYPILKDQQVKAVAYIVPNFLNRPNYLFSYQLEEMAKSSLVEIGAHTMDHLWLKGMNNEKAQYEIAESRKKLQDELHLPIESFAYPYGAFDQQTIQLVKDAGFTNAVSTIPDIQVTYETAYFLYRLRPGYRTGTSLLDYLAQDKFQPW